MLQTYRLKFRHVLFVINLLLLTSTFSSSVYAAGFSNRYEFPDAELPAGTAFVEITVDGRAPRYPETFINDLDGDGVPEFVAFPGGFNSGQCRPLLIALSSVRTGSNIDSTDSRYISIVDANGSVPEDSFCTDIETFETIGDMNGDGFADFALYSQGTHVVLGLQNLSGDIWLADHDGSNGFLVVDALLRRDVGDLNGDGQDELALTRYSPPFLSLGEEYIIRGRTGPRVPVIVPDVDVTGELIGTIISGPENFGLVKPLGDVNADGLDDLLIQQSDNLNIVYGRIDLQIDSNVLADPLTPSIGESCGFFSCPALADFDFDGDGYNDIALSFGRNTNAPSAIVYGGPDGLPTGRNLSEFDPDRVTLLTGSPRLSSGFTDSFGDINADGTDDLYFGSGRDTVVLFATPGRRLTEINLDSLDGSNGFTLAADQVQVSDAVRPRIIGRVLMGDLNGDNIDDFLDGQLLVEGIDDAPIGEVALGILVRQGPESADFFWRLLDDNQSVAGYRISVDNQVLAELSADTTTFRVNVDSRSQTLDVRISAVGSDGAELGASIRRIQRFGTGFGLQGEVYGPNLVEVIWDAPADDYLLWRDGEVHAFVNGHSYVDTDVAPGVSHEYFVTDDVLTGGAPNAEYLNSLEGQQRRTTAINIGPDGVTQPEVPEVPDPAVDSRPDTPADLAGVVYSTTAAEIFWSRVTNTPIQQYDVYKNGELVASVEGTSWFESNLSPAQIYRYSIVAVSVTGLGSLASPTLELSTLSDTPSANTGTVAPTGLRGTVYSDTALELFWDRDETQARQYVVLINGVEAGRTDGISFYIDGLLPGTEYSFTVQIADQGTTEQVSGAQLVLSTAR